MKSRKTTAKTTARRSVALVPQLHGGALKAGGTPGNRGGAGRPPNELREQLRGVVSRGVGVLDEILDGDPVRHMELPLTVLLRHARCPKCNGKLEALDQAEAPNVRFGVKASASPRDRMSAVEIAARYGLGTKDEITMISPDVKDRIQRTVQLIASHKTWKAQELLDQLEEVWK